MIYDEYAFVSLIANSNLKLWEQGVRLNSLNIWVACHVN